MYFSNHIIDVKHMSLYYGRNDKQYFYVYTNLNLDNLRLKAKIKQNM